MTNSDRPTRGLKIGVIKAVASKSAFKLGSLFLFVCDSAQGRIFDRLIRVSTRGIIVTESSNFVAGGDNCAYAGCQWVPVSRALKDLALKPSDVFVDLGSGKGKALLIAGRLPYKRVIGVEVDDELSQCAKRNIKLAQSRLRTHQVDIITASVLEWPLPDETSVVFMYNPFIGQTFRAVARQVFESYDRMPRNLHIVYEYPWEHDWLMSTGRVVVDSVRPSTWPARLRWWQTADVIVSYRVVGVGKEGRSESSPHRLTRRHRAVQCWAGSTGQRFTISAPGQKTIYSSP
jgi:SAM-dependent methyltransferase